MDPSSRRVVGWSMADHMRTELVADALRLAIAARHPAPGLIFHSDRETHQAQGVVATRSLWNGA